MRIQIMNTMNKKGENLYFVNGKRSTSKKVNDLKIISDDKDTFYTKDKKFYSNLVFRSAITQSLANKILKGLVL